MADALAIHASSLDAEGCYKLLSGVVVPRPIAWITTQSEAGLVNLAPFSCYTYVCSKPPMVGINIGRRAGQRKDTSRNIVAHGEFVVNIGDETMVEAVHRSAEEYPPEVSETQLLGLELAPSELIATPRLAAVPVAMECRLHSVQEFGETRAEFIVGEVLVFHFRAGICKGGKVDTAALRPLARLGGPNYAGLGPMVTMAAVSRTPQMVTVTDGG
jgi:flavin reductase (DIM6/NTAB) family NADH-FMN oxidoreductase RutF